MMKTRIGILQLICWLLAGISLPVTSCCRGADDVIRVFVLAGQSNMVGADAHAERIDEFPEFRGAGIPQEDVRFAWLLGHEGQRSKGWEVLRPLESFGPEITFARRVAECSPGPIACFAHQVPTKKPSRAYKWLQHHHLTHGRQNDV